MKKSKATLTEAEEKFIRKKLAKLRKKQGKPSRDLLKEKELVRLNEQKLLVLSAMLQSSEAKEERNQEKAKRQERKAEVKRKKQEEKARRREEEAKRLELVAEAKQKRQEEKARRREEEAKRLELVAEAKQKRQEEEVRHRAEQEAARKKEEAEFAFKASAIEKELMGQRVGLTIKQGIELASAAALKLISEERIQHFFKLLIKGDNKAGIEECLKQTPLFAYVHNDIVDIAHRQFTKVTVLQYAVWSLDWEMCNLLLQYIPEADAAQQLYVFELERDDIVEKYGFRYNIEDLVPGIEYKDSYKFTTLQELSVPSWLSMVLLGKGIFSKYSEIGKRCALIFSDDDTFLRKLRADVLNNFKSLKLKLFNEISIEEVNLLGQQEAELSCLSPGDAVKLQAERISLPNKSVNQFLQYVMTGDLGRVGEVLMTCKLYLYAQGDITDLSSRKFTRITAFQYAVWALDKPMWELILSYLPKGVAARQLLALEREREDLISQFGSHFNMSELILKMGMLVKNWDIYDAAKRDKYWVTEVGGAQSRIPAWLIMMWMEKGENVAWTQNEINMSVVRFKENLIAWFSFVGISKLGVNMAQQRGKYSVCVHRESPFGLFDQKPSEITHDLKMLSIVSEVRIKDIVELRNKIMPIQVLEEEKRIKDEIVQKQFLEKRKREQNSQLIASIPGNIKIEILKAFMFCVVRGDLEGVKKYLVMNEPLAYAKCDIVDISGRKFSQITAFQYAVWALDKPMWELLLNYITVFCASQQIYEFLNYRVDLMKLYHGCYRFDNLIDNLKKYYHELSKSSYSGRTGGKKQKNLNQLWAHDVGGEQAMIPAWLVYMWTAKSLGRNWSALIEWKGREVGCPYERVLEELECWIKSKEGKLGSNIAILRGDGEVRKEQNGAELSEDEIKTDLDFLIKIAQSAYNERELLLKRLKSDSALAEHAASDAWDSMHKPNDSKGSIKRNSLEENSMKYKRNSFFSGSSLQEKRMDFATMTPD